MFGGIILSPVIVYLVVRFGFYEILKTSMCVVFTTEHITIKNTYSEKHFDRHQPHSFALYSHDKAEREEKRLSYLESKSKRRWWKGARKRYYNRSAVLSLEYFEQRNDIRVVFGAKECRSFLTRLRACDQIITRCAVKGSEQALCPESDWPEQSGDLKTI